MAHGRDTNQICIDKGVRAEILRNVDQPTLLAEIFELARGLAFGRGSVLEFDAFCRSHPCILWVPEEAGLRHVKVRIRREPDRVMVHVARVVHTIVHVIAAQGPLLGSTDELLHACGRNGVANSAYGVCLNPAHFVAGNAENRIALHKTRELMKRLSLKHVAVAQ